MSHERVTIMMPTDPVYQGLLAMLIGRSCMATRTVWTPPSLAPVLTESVLEDPLPHYLQGILANKKLYSHNPRAREEIAKAHTVMVSLYPDEFESLDLLKTLLIDKAGTRVGISRTSVLIALFAWAAELPTHDLNILLKVKSETPIRRRIPV